MFSVWASAAVPVAAQPAAVETATTVASCRVASGTTARVYELQRTGPGEWQLVMRGGEAGTRAITLALPRAAPQRTASSLSLEYRSGNGGRQVTMHAGSGSDSMEVWVDYGLEVNVDTRLDPRIDIMNTDGPQPATCTVKKDD